MPSKPRPPSEAFDRVRRARPFAAAAALALTAQGQEHPWFLAACENFAEELERHRTRLADVDCRIVALSRRLAHLEREGGR
jgi:hypothetical protein